MLPLYAARSPVTRIKFTAPRSFSGRRYWLYGILTFFLLWVGIPHLLPHPPPHYGWPHYHDPGLWNERAEMVRDAFTHAYEGYRVYAMPADELLPVTGRKVDNFNGWGVTMYDALDTMWLLDLEDYFDEAVDLITGSHFLVKTNSFVPFFETVIRYLGGLLSAYALSQKPVLLEKADELGKMLLPALDTPSGLPMYAINPQTGNTRYGWSGATALWAEALSNQMEYKYLAHLTGNHDYHTKVEHIMSLMYGANITTGQFPTMWDVNTGNPKSNTFSVGAYADSALEYLLKQWLLTGQSEPKIKQLYLEAMSAIIKNLLYITPNRTLLYVTDTRNLVPSHAFEHLSCFLPGLFALGTHTLDLSPEDSELHMWAAKGLAYTCWISYADQASGLGPDEMIMTHFSVPAEGRWIDHIETWKSKGRPGDIPPGLHQVSPQSIPKDRDYSAKKTTYLLRPEALESWYILWKVTGNETWRQRSWTVFEAIERYCKTRYGYASLSNVDKLDPPLKDEMPSYFMSETLKYLYLTFSEKDILPLHQWVLNTEAHPLPVFHFSKEEKLAYNITI